MGGFSGMPCNSLPINVFEENEYTFIFKAQKDGQKWCTLKKNGEIVKHVHDPRTSQPEKGYIAYNTRVMVAQSVKGEHQRDTPGYPGNAFSRTGDKAHSLGHMNYIKITSPFCDGGPAWSAWSACDVTCGDGTKTRTKVVSGETLTDTVPCSTQACADWSPWGE